MDFSSIQRKIVKDKVLSIDLKFIDLNGEIRKVTISKEEFNQKLMNDGIGFDGSSVTGFRKTSAGDLVLIPDLSTMHYDPFTLDKVVSFMCDIKEADTREQFQDDPRFLAKKAVTYMKKSGIADEALFAPEYEFYMFSSISYDCKPNQAFYKLQSEEGHWNTDFDDASEYLAIPMHKGYHRALPQDRYFEVRQQIVKAMFDRGISFRYHHHEVGSPSQHEIEVPLTPILQAAENTAWIKYIIKNTARKNNLYATFMPKPLTFDAGSGMHMHIMLKNKNENCFFGNKYGNLSDTALYFIAGILYHSPSLCAITNPTVNSYKRLIPGYEAPTNLCFSIGNRSAAIRIPKYATHKDDVRFEFRTPDGAANPYIALPAVLMAGLDGVRKKLDPVAFGFGPFDTNIHDMPESERQKIKSIPKTFDEALNNLEADHDFLLEGNAFTKNFIYSWIRTKRMEVKQFYYTIDPMEFKLYFDC